ncbi:MAG: C25 family cysteine peptidase, partial [Ferruginibacter sp.]
MKKVLFTLAVILFGTVGYAQLNNSWIDYSKTYYKFYIAKDTLCRISQTTLQAAGLGSTPAQNFQLWRNGIQVRIYTSVASGVLGASDYIEFWGEMNDGKPDKTLYKNPDYQLDDKYSLYSDTATYYLTVNPLGGNLRYTQVPNPVATNVLPVDAYFLRRIETHYKDALNPGYAEILGENVYSSSYDISEGWTSRGINSAALLSKALLNINKYNLGPANSVTFTIAAAGNSPLYTRNLTAKFYGVPVLPAPSPMPYFSYRKDTIRNLPLTSLPNLTSLVVQMGGESSSNPTNDYVAVATFSVTYPATFNFNAEKNFYFELAASATGNYLVINNFNNNGIPPILYDINNGFRYIGDIGTPGQVKFALPASANPVRKFNLMSQDSSNISLINQITTKSFVNINLAANQGDYIIISNPVLYDNGSGINYVDQYKQYRSSIAGGGYNAKVYDINELIEQFGFGIKKHPTAIRDFIRFANQQFTVPPKFVFLIGRAVNYYEYKLNEIKANGDYNTDVDKLCLVPTFGWPASDVLLASNPGTLIPLTPIGRLGAIYGNEVGNYLQKMKEYELAQKSTSQTIADKAWMKNILHIAGGSDSLETSSFIGHLNEYKRIAEDTSYGAHVETFAKSSSGAIQESSVARVAQLFKEGLGYITYFGHSSASTLAFNLSNPEDYLNPGKYPFVNVSGCLAGNFFNFDASRLSGNLSLSEKYVLASQKGSIGFFADTHFGIEPFLDYYNTGTYNQFCRLNYGGAIGDQLKQVITNLGSNPSSLNYYTRIHIEELALHGDPALRINYFTKPDYVMEEQLIQVTPSIISVADNSFNLNVSMMNIGSAFNDSIRVTIIRKLPNDSLKVLYNGLITSIKNRDSIVMVVPINPITDKGLNKIIVSLDVDNKVPELSEINNAAEKQFYIYEDELRPVYPYNMSIVNQQNITYTANTANPLSAQRLYTMEIDTTESFNSGYKKNYTVSGVGGIVEFKPANITFTDSTVYYWRTSVVPIGSANVVWNTSSFVFLANSSAGFNQSHYFQFQKSNYTDINLNATNRKLEFPSSVSLVEMINGVFPVSATLAQDFEINVNGVQIVESVCSVTGPIIISAFNPIDFKPISNSLSGPGLYGSSPVCGIMRKYSFSYDVSKQVNRIAAVNFLENIVPVGYYVVVMNFANSNPLSNTFADVWLGDTTVMGSGKSLYNTLKNSGFSLIDSFYRPRAFNFIYKKVDPSVTPVFSFSAGVSDKLNLTVNCISKKGS